jgi:protein LSM14
MSSNNAETTLTDAKVRIITNSDIRYEGTLYKINATEKTIALKDVTSFGTEDRRTDRVIPPSSLIYEYIVFRSVEIKDLIVLKKNEEAQKAESKEAEKPQNQPLDQPKAEPEVKPKASEEVKPEAPQHKESERHAREHHDKPRHDNRERHQRGERRENPRQNRQPEAPAQKFQFDEMLEKLQIIEKDKDNTKDKFKDKKYQDDNFFDEISTSVNSTDRREIEDYRDKKMSNETFGSVSRQGTHYKDHYRGRGHQGNRGQAPRDNRDYQGNRDYRDNRDHRDNRDYRDHRDNYDRDRNKDNGYNQRPYNTRGDFQKKKRGGGGAYRPRDNNYEYVKKED